MDKGGSVKGGIEDELEGIEEEEEARGRIVEGGGGGEGSLGAEADIPEKVGAVPTTGVWRGCAN